MDPLERFRLHRRTVAAGCGAVALAAGMVGVTGGEAAAATTTPEAFSVVVGEPQITTIDLESPGKTPGDLYAIRAPVFDPGGNEIGRLLAAQTSIRRGKRAETVQVTGTFELAGGTIVIAGLSLYPLGDTGNIARREFVRPVIGGTGRYAGVGGTVTTVRRDDGRYDQRFSLTGVPETTVTLTAHSNGVVMQRTDLGTPGPSLGDVQSFSVPLTDQSGAVIGSLPGAFFTVAIDDQVETVMGPLTFELPDGQIAVDGVAQAPRGSGSLTEQTPFVRAVTGGTGAYAGTSGVVTTIRTSDGGYDQTFHIQSRQQLTRKLRLNAGRGTARTVDMSPPGASAADLTVFSTPMRNMRGRRVGRAHGTQTAIERRGDELVVQARITYDLRGGQIVVGGLSRYPANDNRPIRGRRFVRPVLGGTGRYAGARGTLTTVTRKDGSFRQVFRLTE